MREQVSEIKERLQPLVEDLPEIYQDIEVKGEVLWKGKRECETRWEAIEPEIRPGMVILDLGSSTGYFTVRIAKKFPSCLVVSVESGTAEAEVQREILWAEGLTNVVLLNKRLDVQDLRELNRTVEGIDLVLALSVLHHFPEGTILEALKILSLLSPNMIADVPGREEIEACGQGTIEKLDPFDEALEWFYPDIRVLDTFPSHLGNYERKLYLGSGICNRTGLLAYWDSPNTNKLHRISKIGGEWNIDNKKGYISGVNVWTLLHLNPIWPEPAWWQKQARIAWQGLIDAGEFVSDVRAWNMLFTSAGLCAIDFSSRFVKGDWAEYREGDIDKLVEIFVSMKPVDWNTL